MVSAMKDLSLLGVYRVDMFNKVEKVDNFGNRIPSDMIWTCEGSGPPGASSLKASIANDHKYKEA